MELHNLIAKLLYNELNADGYTSHQIVDMIDNRDFVLTSKLFDIVRDETEILENLGDICIEKCTQYLRFGDIVRYRTEEMRELNGDHKMVISAINHNGSNGIICFREGECRPTICTSDELEIVR